MSQGPGHLARVCLGAGVLYLSARVAGMLMVLLTGIVPGVGQAYLGLGHSRSPAMPHWLGCSEGIINVGVSCCLQFVPPETKNRLSSIQGHDTAINPYPHLHPLTLTLNLMISIIPQPSHPRLIVKLLQNCQVNVDDEWGLDVGCPQNMLDAFWGKQARVMG